MSVLRLLFKDVQSLLFGEKPDKGSMTLWQTELKKASYEYADNLRKFGDHITDLQIEESLSTPSISWCEGKSPMEFIQVEKVGYPCATFVVRERIQEHIRQNRMLVAPAAPAIKV